MLHPIGLHLVALKVAPVNDYTLYTFYSCCFFIETTTTENTTKAKRRQNLILHTCHTTRHAGPHRAVRGVEVRNDCRKENMLV
jgi:hypothetical protein